MLALHVALVMRRLGRISPGGTELSRALAETFITDMDDNMREIGIGDLAVPKKIKRAAAALYDRHRDYGAAMAAGADETGLSMVVATAFAGGSSTVDAAPGLDKGALAHYMQRLDGALAVTSDTDCLAGKLPLPWPPI